MAFTPYGFNYVERIPGSPEERIENGASSATRIIDIDWADRTVVADKILGYPTIVGTGANRWLNRVTPAYHPSWTRNTGEFFLYANSLTIKGIGQIQPPGTNQFDEANVAAYAKARLTIHFETLPYDILTDAEMLENGYKYLDAAVAQWRPDESYLTRYVTKRFHPAAQYITLNSGGDGFKYVDTGGLIAPGTGKMLININLSITWHQIPTALVPCSIINPTLPENSGWIEYMLGRMNDRVFAQCGTGSLLLMACELKPLTSAFGERLWDITYMFKYFRPTTTATHTHVYRPLPGPAYWIETSTDGATNLVAQQAGKSIYDWGDCRNLFRPQAA